MCEKVLNDSRFFKSKTVPPAEEDLETSCGGTRCLRR